MSMMARVMVIVSGLLEYPRASTLSLTSVPGRPVSTSTALSGLMPSADWPSISTIWSPARIARLIGGRAHHGGDHLAAGPSRGSTPT